jgi:hypothetical protein
MRNGVSSDVVAWALPGVAFMRLEALPLAQDSVEQAIELAAAEPPAPPPENEVEKPARRPD